MLLRVRTHAEYLAERDRIASALSPSDLGRLSVGRFATAWEKMTLLDLDPARGLLLSLYSQTAGRTANDPTTYIRSFVLMLHLGLTSVQRWVDDARSDPVLRCLLGAAAVPAASCHYDFANRLTGDDPRMGELWPARKNSREAKAGLRATLKRGDKWVNWDDGDVRDLKGRYWDGASCDAGRWTLALERLLDLVAVRPSAERYGLEEGTFTLSGDGSALHVHSSPHGRRVLEDDEAADGRTHRYTAPDADVGWDSHEGVFYLGYTLYNISWHSREHGIDLPVFVAQRAASQHDALTAMSATAHMLDVDPSLRPAHFCHGSAVDAAREAERARRARVRRRPRDGPRRLRRVEDGHEVPLPPCQGQGRVVRVVGQVHQVALRARRQDLRQDGLQAVRPGALQVRQVARHIQGPHLHRARQQPRPQRLQGAVADLPKRAQALPLRGHGLREHTPRRLAEDGGVAADGPAPASAAAPTARRPEPPREGDDGGPRL